MNRKMLSTLIMAATIAIGGIGVANISANKVTHKNEVLLSRTNTSKTNEAVVINGDNNLILKATPRKNGRCVSYVSVGEMLTIEGTSGNYYKVRVHETNAIGYISMSNAQIINNDEGQALENQSGTGMIINVSKSVNLRAEAGINSSVITELTEGTTFNIIGKEGQWYKVNVNGQTGFIYEEYVGFGNSDVVSNQNDGLNTGVSSESTNTVPSNPINKIVSASTSSSVKSVVNNGASSSASSSAKSVANNNGNSSASSSAKSTVNNNGNSSASSSAKSTVNNNGNSSASSTAKSVANNSGNSSASSSAKSAVNNGGSSSVSSSAKSVANNGGSSSASSSAKSVANNSGSSSASSSAKSAVNNKVTPTQNQPSGSGTSTGKTSNVKPTQNQPSGSGTSTGKPSNVTPTQNQPNGSGTSTGNPSNVTPTQNQPSGSGTSTGKTSNVTPTQNQPSGSGTSTGKPSNVTPTQNQPSGSGTSTGKPSNAKPTQNQPSGSGTSAGIYNGTVQSMNQAINVRTAPNTKNKYSYVIGTIPNNSNVKIISIDNGWYEIEFNGSIGYVNANDVNVNGQNIPTSTSIANKSNSTKQDVNYPTTMKKYVAGELKEYNASCGGALTKSQLEKVTKKIAKAVNPKAAATVFEYLKVNNYRNVNVQELNEALQGKGVFQGQGQAFLNTAKEYNLDPVYLIAQAGLETGWGTSNFAKGTTITEVANLSKDARIFKPGTKILTGYKMIKLKHPVTVYNLFGIGADNSTAAFPNKATITAEATAYDNGWTSIPAAIAGAAQFLSNHYVNNTTIAQNTPYELRYINGTDAQMWHQYSSDINYGQAIGEIMKQYSYLYNSNDTFTFGIPTFQNN